MVRFSIYFWKKLENEINAMCIWKSTYAIVFRLRAALFGCLAVIWSASGSVCVFDFEDPEQRRVSISNASFAAGCVRLWATSGEWSFRFAPKAWKEGMNEWPGVNLEPAVGDWSKYDRLIVDVVKLGSDPSDSLNLYLSRQQTP